MAQSHHFREDILEAKTFLVIRAARRVFQKLGSELDYRNFPLALEKEFAASNIRYRKESSVESVFDLLVTSSRPVAEFLCMDSLVVQLKFTENTRENDCENLKTLLNAINLPIGLLINYSARGLLIQRVTRL
jgi:GxxExxY protein